MKTHATFTLAALLALLACGGCAYRGQVLTINADHVTITIDQALEGGGSLEAQARGLP
jgi:ABC-type glycerol-3-phosphate transport system substrate-binding protein